MNKNDLKLIVIILIIIVIFFIYFTITTKSSNEAIVYHNNNIILTINLNINKIYEVDGDNGKVVIEVNNKRVKVNKENSPYHLCSKQGYISKPNESIICLPNKIIIQILMTILV